MAKQDIRTLTSSELKEAVVGLGEKAFRAKQIEEWLWTKGAASFAEMSNLSKGLRERLDAAFELNRIEVADQQFSSDGTIKCAFDVRAGQVVEGVLIPTSKRMTACISSQAGCSLACKFCATGRLKLLKNLSAGEIYDQVEMIRGMAQEQYNQGLTNIVYMGMGEPLLNYRAVLESVERICGDPGGHVTEANHGEHGGDCQGHCDLGMIRSGSIWPLIACGEYENGTASWPSTNPQLRRWPKRRNISTRRPERG